MIIDIIILQNDYMKGSLTTCGEFVSQLKNFVYEYGMSTCGIYSKNSGANVICKPVTPGGEGECTLQFLNAGSTLKLIVYHDNKKTYAP